MDDKERTDRIKGFRDELLETLSRAYDQRRAAPDLSLQLLRQAAEGLCYCTLLAKNRLALDDRKELGALIGLCAPFLKQDERALHALREWGNRTSHAQGRSDKASVEEATAMFLLTANPMRWLCREILHEPLPPDMEARYTTLTSATRATPAYDVTARGADGMASSAALAGNERRPARSPVASATRVAQVVCGVLALVFAATVAIFFARRAPSTEAGVAVLANDGTDATRPILPATDLDFVDGRGGWGWGNKCWESIKAKRWGWAKAQCDAGMKLNPASPQPRASLLFNQGLIERAVGRPNEARAKFAESLVLQENAAVRAALDSVAP